MSKPNVLCPCRSKRPYRECCEVWHNGRSAPTPEALMRSRFAAYALGKVSYIMRSTHPQSPHYRQDKAAWRRELKAFCRQTDFVGLQILGVGADWVMFRAVLLQAGRDVSFVERSRFVEENGRWLYHSGDIK